MSAFGSTMATPSSTDSEAAKPHHAFSKSDIPNEDIFGPLRDFVDHCQTQGDRVKSEANLVTFNDDGYIVNGPSRVEARNFDTACSGTGSRRLLLLQNLTPDWIAALRKSKDWSPPLDFFLSHVEASDWFSLLHIPEHLPTLSSVESKHLRLQFIVTREMKIDKKDSRCKFTVL